MDDYIKREDAGAKADEAVYMLNNIRRNGEISYGTYVSLFDAICEIVGVSTADVVEVVRCKYCKYSRHWYFDKYLCDLWDKDGGVDVFSNGFCNYGRRRDDAEK